MIFYPNFTEGHDYVIHGGYFKLIGISNSVLLFTSTRSDGSKVPIETVKKELKAIIKRLSYEDWCQKKRGGKCGNKNCGNCHPENFT